MKKTFTIARTELASMFYSPIAWLLLAIFTVQAYSILAVSFEYGHSIKQMGRQSLGALTYATLSGGYGSLTYSMLDKLFLYVPLLTMGVIAREQYSGSIKLLLSSPVKIHQIVIGKYLALMAYFSLLMLVLIVYMFVGGFYIENVDYAHASCGIFGLYLLICSYAAIGLFMSCLTTHQVVAAVSTLAVLAGLSYMSRVGQGIPLVNDITYWMSLSERTHKLIGGLITTKDVLYFLAIVFAFLSFAILKLSDGRKIETKTKRTGRYVLIVMAVMVTGYVSSRPTLIGYWDVTRQQRNSLSEGSLAIIDSVREKKWKLTSYANLLDNDLRNYGLPSAKNREKTRFEKYSRYLPHLEMETVLYYGAVEGAFSHTRDKTDAEVKEMAKIIAHQMWLNFDEVLSPEEIKSVADLNSEGNRFVQHLEIDGKTAVLRMFEDSAHTPGETEILAAFKRVLEGAVKIAFVNGHRERSINVKGDQNYYGSTADRASRSALVNQGYEVVNIALENRVPDDVNILAILDPKEVFSDLEHKHLSQYIARGGNVLIAGDAGRKNILNPFLQDLGVELISGQLLQKNKGYSGDLIQTDYVGNISSSEWPDLSQRPVTALKAVGLEYEQQGAGFVHTPILTVSGDNVWNRTGTIDLDSTALSFTSVTDTKGYFTVGLALTRKVSGREQRILVLGDGDIFSAGELGRRDPATLNSSFAYAAYGWLSHGKYPITIEYPRPTDLNLKVTRDSLLWLKIFFYGLVPALILLSGFMLLYRRKRR